MPTPKRKKKPTVSTPKRVPKTVDVVERGVPVREVEITQDERFKDPSAPVTVNPNMGPGNVVIGITNGVRYGVPGTYSSVNVDLTIHRVVEDDEDAIREEFTYWSGQLQKEIESQINELTDFFNEES